MLLAPSLHRPKRRLSHWIALSVILIVCPITLVVLGLVERFAHIHAAHDATQSLNQIAWQMRDQLDRGMANRYEELIVLSGLKDLQSGQDPHQVRSLLERVQTSFPRYAWLGYCNANGIVEASVGGLLQGQNVSFKSWFTQALKSSPYVGDVHNAALLAQLLPQQREPWRFVDISVPVVDAQGRVSHVLGAHLSWEWARDLRDSLIAPAAKEYQADVFVISNSGQVLLGPKGSEGSQIGLPQFTRVARHLDVSPMQVWRDGLSYATSVWATQGYGRYRGLGWMVVVRQPEAVAFASYVQLKREIFWGGVITCFVTMVAALLVARKLTKPLQILTDALSARSRGENAAIPQISSSYQEANLLSSALATFADQKRQHVDELKRVNEALEHRVQERTAEIRDQEQEIRAILEHANEAFVRVDHDGRVLEWNACAERTFGWSRSQAIGQQFGELVFHANQREAQSQGLRMDLNTGNLNIVDRRMELVAMHKDGLMLEVEMIVSVMYHENGQQTFNAFLHDIGERKRAEAALRESREHLSAIANNLPALVADVDTGLRYRYANKTYRDWFGIEPATLIGQQMRVVYGDEALSQWQPYLDRVLHGERVEFERMREVNGQCRYETATYLPQFDDQGQVMGFHALIFDITARKELEMRLKDEATHDALTGLPNRRNLLAHLPQAMARCDRQNHPLALLFLDLNGFKGVNDTYGHEAGDELLKQSATRMRNVLRKSDSVFRLAGDEFVILLETLTDEADLAGVILKIDQAIERPFELDGTTVRISVSTGVSLYQPRSGIDSPALLATADSAMYESKKARKIKATPESSSTITG
ncbi:MAG TPA: diguanylate cyclase [Aquabacterium sp.]|nr:diguanylate cyclase [Aquabacterium sp.]